MKTLELSDEEADYLKNVVRCHVEMSEDAYRCDGDESDLDWANIGKGIQAKISP